MTQKKYVTLSKLGTFLASLRSTFAPLSHSHKVADMTDYKVDETLSSISINPISNKAVKNALDNIDIFNNGIIVDVLSAKWFVQPNGTYANEIIVDSLTEDVVLDISLYGDNITEDQATAFDEYVNYVDIKNGKIILVSDTNILIDFQLILRGKVDLPKETVVYTKDMTLMDGLVLEVSASKWDQQSDGLYIQKLSVNELLGNESLEVSLYGDEVSEKQAEVFDEYITSIEIEQGHVVLISSNSIDIDFYILLQGKTDFKTTSGAIIQNARFVNFNDDNTRLNATNVQEAIENINSKFSSITQLPDYSSASIVLSIPDTSETTDNRWTVDEDCYIFAYINSLSSTCELFMRIHIDDLIVYTAYSANRNYTYLYSGLYPVKKGSKIRVSATAPGGGAVIKVPFAN